MRGPGTGWTRVVTIVALVAVLGGLFIWAGTMPTDPLEQPASDETEVPGDRGAYVGSTVTLGGQVVETDPVVIATRASGYGQFTVIDATEALQNTDGPLERGDHVTAYGTLEDESTLVAERTLTRESSEAGYMYLVSFLGGLWVVGRFVRGWRFDWETRAFVPRERPWSLSRLLGNNEQPRRDRRGSRGDRSSTQSDRTGGDRRA
ncbi:hypothetical protein [Natrialba taiwanensis]|uniref:OB-fold tRNA/helicase-type nucleic acid binding protein n=1 Tax=Natrialba taiwanensis DSM 12281 TaxID=1230458 RepID=L9ZWX4_9EURY|nr:hypothetical protein [Natrialba taiwanensis]ELY90990.1 hypothetical protein C484_12221 [Natrialba taiwanensis DSM 12281]